MCLQQQDTSGLDRLPWVSFTANISDTKEKAKSKVEFGLDVECPTSLAADIVFEATVPSFSDCSLRGII